MQALGLLGLVMLIFADGEIIIEPGRIYTGSAV
jgi:hypothetical protein